MTKQTSSSQRGSLIVEVLALLGMIALLTPIMYQQIAKRNEDIANINIATEIRGVKDALAAYTSAYEAALAHECGLFDSTTNTYGDVPEPNDTPCIIDYPSETGGLSGRSIASALWNEGFYPGSADILDVYAMAIYGYTVPAGYFKKDDMGNEIEVFRPIIFGVVAEEAFDQENRTIKRSSSIASLVGTDGGVTLGSELMGMNGSWILGNGMQARDKAVVATTAFEATATSAILTDVKIEHFLGDTIQGNVGVIDKLHAPTYFSVGNNSYACVTNYGTDVASIAEDGATTNCMPLFEVDGKTGDVKLRTGIAAFVTSRENGSDPALVVPDATIDAVTEGGKYANFQVDPAYTSVMNDIKLASRGGARLSEVLPNYISKDIVGSPASGTTWTVNYPICPVGYAPAVVVHPMNVGTDLKINLSNISANTSTGNLSRNSAVQGDVSGSVIFVITSTNSAPLKTEPVNTQSPNATGTWTIEKRSHNAVTNSWTTAVSYSSASHEAVAYTYCVYDPEAAGFIFGTKDRPDVTVTP